MSTAPRRIVLLIDGQDDPLTAKTAVNVLRYCGDEVSAVLDRTHAGRTAEEVLGVGGSTPVIGRLEEAPDANTLMVGIAPPGGKVPPEWAPLLLEAIQRGMNLASGLHEFLSDNPKLRDAAAAKGVSIWDVRRNTEHEVATGKGIREDRLRLLTIGNDCSVGKMLAALELANDLKRRGEDAKFVATGQTGIMIDGGGCPIDCVVSDFVNGAVEKLVRNNQHHEIMVFEGQATLAHPRYSCVSAGLLHGCQPHGMVLVYEAGRTEVHGMSGIPLRPLKEIIAAYESLAALRQSSKVIAVAINSRRLSTEAARDEQKRVSDELGIPAVDPIRDGSGPISDAVLALKEEVLASSAVNA